MSWLVDRLFVVIPLIVSLVIHEYAHARAAAMLGDDTARKHGRLTLDPTAHIDPIGTVLLPLLGIPFGWAKPVPVDPTRFRRTINMRFGMAVTAFAGPLSNIVLAGVFAIAFGALVAVLESFAPAQWSNSARLLATLMSVNVSLAVFNLLPIPPLDGSRIVDWALPAPFRPAWESFKPRANWALLLLILGMNRLPWSPFDAGLSLATGLAGYVATTLAQ